MEEEKFRFLELFSFECNRLCMAFLLVYSDRPKLQRERQRMCLKHVVVEAIFFSN